jgi:hypothetical protein
MHRLIVLGMGVLLVAGTALAAPWWDDFPRMVDDNAVSVVTNYHGNMAMNGCGQDPSWGTFYQRFGIESGSARFKGFKQAGIKQIGYYEAFGQNYCLVAELGAWNGTNLTPVLHHHWSWANYGGGATRWLGVHNFFDDDDFARPYTRTHPRYGGRAMTYPDGRVATGYNGPTSDPRNSRVYDAGGSKNILGELVVDKYYYPEGPTNGLVYVAEADDYAGLIYFLKDSACPLWNDYTYASALQAVDAGSDGMWNDNFGAWDSLGIYPVEKGFGEWSVARFRNHLKTHFSSTQLRDLGVADVSEFDIRETLKAIALERGWDGKTLNHSAWKDSAWLDDPLWRAYLIFKRKTGAEALSGYYAAAKTAVQIGGKPEFLVAGNDMPGFNFGWCRGDLDMVSTEAAMGWQLANGGTGFTPPPVGRFAPIYKLAREHAKSRFVQVWFYNDHYAEELTHPELCKVLYYEMLSTHTLPKIDPGNPRFGGDETTNAGFFEFVERVAPIYGARVPVEEVGVYYSSSSILRQLTPRGFMNHDAQPHQFGFWGWATALGELHHQYRAIPEWKLTAETLATLRLLVIPNAEVFDPADVAVLIPWIKSGGRLIITGDSGTYLGESGNFALHPEGGSLASLTHHANVIHLPDNMGMDYYLAYSNRPALLPLISATIDRVLKGASPAVITKTTASSRTGLTLYEDEAAGKFFIDVNNFDMDPSTYSMSSTGVVEIEVVLPPWLRGKRLKLTVLSPQAESPQAELLAAPSPDVLRIKLSPVEYYAGLVIQHELD